jgi:thioesterase III
MKGKLQIKVRGYHLDMFSHVNNARYLEFLEEARWELIEESKINFNYYAEKGLSLAVVNINIDYKFPAGFGSVLEIITETKKLGNRSITLNQKIFIEGTETIVIDADVVFVIIDSETGRAIELTEEIKKFW